MLTNNPKQRPIFAGFDSVLTQMASALVPMLITTILAEKYSVGEFAGENGKGLGMINPAMWKEAAVILAVISFVFTILPSSESAQRTGLNSLARQVPSQR